MSEPAQNDDDREELTPAELEALGVATGGERYSTPPQIRDRMIADAGDGVLFDPAPPRRTVPDGVIWHSEDGGEPSDHALDGIESAGPYIPGPNDEDPAGARNG